MTATLFTGGTIWTPTSPDATALAHDNGAVVWVGQDRPAIALHPDAKRIDLAGQWVAPAFVECLPGQFTDTDAAAVGAVTAQIPPADTVDRAADALARGERVIIDAEDDLAKFADVLSKAALEHGQLAVARCTPTIVGTPALDDATAETLAQLGTVVLLRPLLDPLDGVDVVQLAARGLVVAASMRSRSTIAPWDTLRALTEVEGGRGLSPRAALTAVTRGAHKAAGVRDGQVGVLTPGAPATFARWRTGELLTVAADDAVQRWSTDPRSGVPPMPDLHGPNPLCCGLVDNGIDLS